MTLLCQNCGKETRVLIPVKVEQGDTVKVEDALTVLDSFWCMSCINNEDEET